eukprot:4845316-Pyramimonas_sp.AAC.1
MECAAIGGEPHAHFIIGAFDVAPLGTTKCVRRVPQWVGNRMRTLPSRPSVQLPMGSRDVYG